MLSHRPASWVAVVPVKPLRSAKTRLRGAVPAAVHPDLVLAMARDTVAAALACRAVTRVVVVCDDPAVRAELTRLGATCVPDTPAAGLNAALAFGARNADGPVVALTADLPALRATDLESALAAAERAGRRAFVPDQEGTGTVLLATPPGVPLAPHFGPGSAAAHLRSGATRLDGTWPSLRRDVDTAADLHAATSLGVGTHTGHVICTVA
ncbi:2-phospho-L-lactate guanylyltransferase [Dactylosporangium sp. AC04546]|uniref:2-phospho-L-lactate guanylyltransferase n=1 Tax=Dactylosporangium sp. AC04546 TaxID=2862460 RepID=UPI001EDCC847|nr:2-phospho-L-lactate guanylyltransferase [Dactylosporangium sp. AC04546]WVK85211.1 2-phospho-L-lactate guanylyltransferase [Dactylosporangium sp. AC04546]